MWFLAGEARVIAIEWNWAKSRQAAIDTGKCFLYTSHVATERKQDLGI